MTGSNGHVEPIAGAQQPARQPLPSDFPARPAVSAGWRPEPPPVEGGTARRRIDPPGLVVAAAVLSIVLGAVLLAVTTSDFGGTASTWMVLLRLLFPVILVVGGVQALRGRRGWLTTGAVFLVLTGSVLVLQVLGSDLYDTRAATIEAAVRIGCGVLLLVFGRVSASRVFFDTAEEYRYGRKEADFFR